MLGYRLSLWDIYNLPCKFSIQRYITGSSVDRTTFSYLPQGSFTTLYCSETPQFGYSFVRSNLVGSRIPNRGGRRSYEPSAESNAWYGDIEMNIACQGSTQAWRGMFQNGFNKSKAQEMERLVEWGRLSKENWTTGDIFSYPLLNTDLTFSCM